MPIEKFINEMKKISYRIKWDAQPVETSKALRNFYKIGKFCDLKLICQSQTIKAHKCILAAHSTYFQERFEEQKDLNELKVLGITYPTLKALIDYIYEGDISFPEENTKDFLESARFFGITGLRCLFHQTITGLHQPSGTFIGKQPVFIMAKTPEGTVTSGVLSPCTLLNTKIKQQDDIETQKTIRKTKITANGNHKLNIRESIIAPTNLKIDRPQTDVVINKSLQPPQYQTSSNITQAQDELIDNYISGAPKLVPLEMNTFLPTLKVFQDTNKLTHHEGELKQAKLNDKLLDFPVQSVNLKSTPAMTFAEIMEEALNNDIILEPDEQKIVTPKKEFAPVTFVQKKIPINFDHIIRNPASILKKNDDDRDKFIIKRKCKNTAPKTYKNGRKNKKSNKPKIRIIRDEIVRPRNNVVERNDNILGQIINAPSNKKYPAYRNSFKYVFGKSP